MAQTSQKLPAAPAVFVEPLRDVKPIRFAPRDPLDAASLTDLPLVSALCAPLYDEIEGVLGCEACPSEEDFRFPGKGEVKPVRRGSPRWNIQQTFRGNFSEPGLDEALLVTAGCEWRSISVVLVEQQAGTWSYVGRSEETPLDLFDKCQLLKSARWGDRLICSGWLVTQFAGVRRMRGSRPYAIAVFETQGRPSSDATLALSPLFIIRDAEACESEGGRGQVINVKLNKLVASDQNNDGQDDLEIGISYSISPVVTQQACAGKAPESAATLRWTTTSQGLKADASTRRLLGRLRAE